MTIVVLVIMFAMSGCATTPTPTPIPTPTTPVSNNPPDTPVEPSGSESGYTGTSYTYSTSATDPDDGKVKYVFNWGDGMTSETGFVSSGTTGSKSHSWSNPGTYFVRVKTMDDNGASSDWSDFKKVSISIRTYALSTSASPPGSGSITPSEGTYEVGTPVSLTAQPSSGYVFDHWGDDAAGSSISIDITMNSDKHVIAYFTTPPTVEPSLEWSKTFGGEGIDVGRSVQQTADGGYIIVGDTRSYGAGGADIWLIKTDSNGNRVWEQTFGGTKTDSGYVVQQTADGGYIIAGSTESYGLGFSDVWLVKTDSNGNKLWDKTFGGGFYEWGWSVQQTADGGYIITGSVIPTDVNIWLIKTDSNGTQSWYRTFSGKSYEKAVSSVRQTADGGYIIVSDTRSYKTGVDVWLIKTDSDGDKMWEQTFGGTDMDIGSSVQQTSDGGYIITGKTKSYGAGDADVWLIKTDAGGYKVWDQTFGGTEMDAGFSVQQTSDGGYIITGETKSYGAGDTDVWLIKTDAGGYKVWDQTFGSTEMDAGFSVQQTSDGGYIITGETKSYGAGDADVWLLKLSVDSWD